MAHHYLATALFNAQEFEAAEPEFRQTVRLEPTANNHYYLAACLMSMGRYDDAMGELETASRMAPGQDLYRARKEELLRLMKETARNTP
jgi:Flp pilus assembly protein TadD